jgi:hypothetical protein
MFLPRNILEYLGISWWLVAYQAGISDARRNRGHRSTIRVQRKAAHLLRNGRRATEVACFVSPIMAPGAALMS